MIFAGLAACAWAVVQLVDKVLVSDEDAAWRLYVAIVGLTAGVSLVVLVALRFDQFTDYGIGSVGFALAAGVCYFAGNAAFFASLTRLDASVSATSLATIPAVTAVGSWIVLGQDLRPLAVVGIACMTLGVILVAGSGLSGDEGSRWRGGDQRAWLLLIAATGFYAAEYVIEGHAVTSMHPIDVLLWTRVAIFGCGILMVAAWPELARAAVDWAWRPSPRIGITGVVNELLDVTAVGLLITAYSHGPVGPSTAVAYSQPILVFAITLIANRWRPGTIPTEGDQAGARLVVARGLGICAVVAGVALAVS